MGLTAGANPFQHRGAVGEGFVGRARELREVFALLGKPTPMSVSVVGPPKIGRTSFLQHLARPEVRARFLPRPEDRVMHYLNFEGLAGYSELEVLQKLLWEVHAALALHGLEPADDEGLDLLLATPMRLVEGLSQAFRSLSAQGRRFVFLFDDFEASCQNSNLSLGFFNTLRSFASGFGVGYVVATRKELFQLPVYRMGRSSPFFNYFTTVYLGLMPEPEARDLVRRLPDLEPQEERFVLESAGGLPFLQQVLLFHLWERKAEAGALEEEDLAEVFSRCQAGSRTWFEACWTDLTEEEQGAAADLACGRPRPDLAPALVRRGLAREGILACSALREFVLSKAVAPRTPPGAPPPTPGW